MSSKILALLGFVLFFAGFNPILGKETNASRLKRGLPPLPPASLFNKRPASAQPSYTPRPPWYNHPGRIHVFAGNGTALGYVGDSPVNGLNTIADSGEDLHVQPLARGELFDLSISSSTPKSRKTPLYLGVVTARNKPLRDLIKVSLSTVNQARRTTASEKGFIQSTIWSIDPSTKELKAQYLDPDGSKHPVLLAFDSHGNELHFVGDINLYNSVNRDFPSIVVRFYLSED
ncbi:hypothetical protein C8R46DRAFT_1070173 [Mycena filopes]|nr:hypothetical protein C8R46DRAFT_1070173 [Mycena filopes]